MRVSNQDMNESEVNEIIDFINAKYNKQNAIVKIVGGMIRNKIETFQLDDWPVSLRSCPIEQLVLIVKDALRQGRLNL